MLGTGAASRLEPQAVAQRAASKAPVPSAPKAEDCNCSVSSDGSPLDIGTSEIRPAIERYQVELRDLNRVYALPGSALRRAKLEKFYADQLRLLERVVFDSLSQATVGEVVVVQTNPATPDNIPTAVFPIRTLPFPLPTPTTRR